MCSVKAGIRERTSAYIVSENSWPLFVYENYAFNSDDLEKGLFMSKILVQVSTFVLCREYVLKVAALLGLQSHLYITIFRKGSRW